jgi:alkaline phosphatase D
MAMGLTGTWDSRISRRTLLRTGGTLAAGLVLFDRAALRADAAPAFEGFPFPLGVSSGDMTADSVVLWTRLAPLGLDGTGMPEETYGVRYELATDPDFARIERQGTVAALPDEVHSVHAEVGGLQPDTTYWYRFKWGETESRVGRTRTAPLPSETPDPLRFAFVSCQNFTHGYFTAYADLALQDVAFVVHLGDYIYEGPGLSPGVRAHLPAATLMSLSDYRTRHAQYQTDTDLQRAHATFPFVMTWDDHEFKNNYGDLDVDEPKTPLADVAARRAAAYLAYWEHAPLARARKPVGKDMLLYRRVDWGSLARFHVLDTRQYRSPRVAQCSPARRDPESGYCPAWLDPARVMLGATQRDWLLKNLAGSKASWNVLANQVPFAPEDRTAGDARAFFPDRWDGFVAERQRILDFIAEHGLGNVVAITGDSHVNAVRNVPGSFRSMDSQPVATEFVGTSITTDNEAPTRDTTYGGDPDNPHHLFYNDRRGYVIVDAEPQRWTSTFRVVESVKVPQSPVTSIAAFAVEQGAAGAYRL